MNVKKIVLISFLPLIIFICSLFLHSSYGVNWDTYQHLARGQTYVRYIFFNEKDSNNLPQPCLLDSQYSNIGQGRECPLSYSPRISLYEKSDLDLEWANKMTIGHPPLLDIILATSNQIFFKHFGIIDDITAYHIVLLFFSFAFSLLISVWAYQTIGFLGSLISVISLNTIPLFFAEQHFNIKDPPVAFFVTATAYAIWHGIRTKKLYWFIISGLFAGLGLGTKFNIVFLLLPVLLWLPFGLTRSNKTSFLSLLCSKSMLLLCMKLAIIPLLAWLIFWISYPSIWFNPLSGTIKVIEYYKDISNVGANPCFFPLLTGKWFLCSTVQAPLLFLSTIPIITLVLSVVGICLGLKKLAVHNAVYLFWILLLLLPLLRATLPVVELYGGSLRQIMEIIGPLSLLSGLGATMLVQYRKKNYIKKIMIFSISLLFIPIIHTLIILHPNQNIFYNSLVGGSRGAAKIGLPVVGNTYGNGYKQLIEWLNIHAPANSRFTVVNAIASAFPSLYIRPDIQYVSDSLDITKQSGEYLLDLFLPGMTITDRFRYRYASQLLSPVFELKVNNITLGAIWHNTHEKLKSWATSSHAVIPTTKNITPTIIELTLPQPNRLKELRMYSTNEQCLYALTTGIILVKDENTQQWDRFAESISNFNNYVSDIRSERVYYFAGDTAKQLRVMVRQTECDLSTIQYTVWAFGTGGGDQIVIPQKYAH